MLLAYRNMMPEVIFFCIFRPPFLSVRTATKLSYKTLIALNTHSTAAFGVKNGKLDGNKERGAGTYCSLHALRPWNCPNNRNEQRPKPHAEYVYTINPPMRKLRIED